MRDRLSQRLEHDEIIEQQQKERMLGPYRAHEAARRREEEAPMELRRILAQRDMRLRAQIAQAEEEVADNKREKAREQREMIEARREERGEVVHRIDTMLKERQTRTEEHAVKLGQKLQAVEKMEAKKQLMAEMRRKERDAAAAASSALNAAVYRSAVSNGEVISDSDVDKVVAGGGGGGKKLKRP